MYKVSTFLSESDYGYSAVPLFGPADSVFEKHASISLLPEVLAYIKDLKPKAGSQYVLVNAMGAGEYYGSNINGDHFEEAGLIHTPPGWTGNPLTDRQLGRDWTYGYPTFYNAYPYAHHRNKDPSRAYGEVELAVWNELMKRVELVCRVDYDKCEQFGGVPVWDKLKAGQFPDVSMGSKVCYDLSSIMTDWEEYNKALATFNPTQYAYPGLAVVEYHKKLRARDNVGIRGLSITRADYDEWTTNHMNRILPDGRKVFVYNPYPRFFDISFVFIGADRTAKVMVFIVRHGTPRYVPSAEAGEKISSARDVLVHPFTGEPIVKAAAAELFHGSAEKRDVLEPHSAKGQNTFQSQDAVYASTEPLEAMLYAVGSTLKDKTDYAVTPKDRLVIVGDAEPKAGFLHTLPSDGAVYGRGRANEGQAYVKDEVEPSSVKKVTPSSVDDHIVHVATKAELKKELRKDTKEAAFRDLHDKDRRALYPPEHRLTLAECQALVDAAYAGYGLPPPAVAAGPSAYGSLQGVQLSPKHRVPFTVLHEAAHGLAEATGEAGGPHGQDFQSILGKLVQEHGGPIEQRAASMTLLGPKKKLASLTDSALKIAFGFKGAEDKQGEIEKELPADKAVPLLARSEKDIPEWAVRALSSVPEDKALGTSGAMGIVLKPREFQRITLIRLGKEGLADECDAHGELFPSTEEATPCPLGPSSFLPALARLLMPLLTERSGLAPFSEKRVLMVQADGDETSSSHPREDLRKIGAAYNGYRQALMELVASAQDLLPTAAPSDVMVQKLASAEPAELFTPFSYRYFKHAFLNEVPFVDTMRGVVEQGTQSAASVKRGYPSRNT